MIKYKSMIINSDFNKFTVLKMQKHTYNKGICTKILVIGLLTILILSTFTNALSIQNQTISTSSCETYQTNNTDLSNNIDISTEIVDSVHKIGAKAQQHAQLP
jgi:hypothetical protein